jgi:cytochrome P450
MTTTAIEDPRLYDPDTFVSGVPHDLFRQLRREAPVYRQEMPDGEAFWVLSKYDDIVTVSNDSQTYSSAKGVILGDMGAGYDLMMLNMDPPRHTKLRNLVSKGFTPKMVRAMEPHIRDITNAIIDKIAKRGECDFVVDVAAELPLQVIAQMIGVPQEDRHLIFDWGNQMVGVEDPEYATSMETATNAAAAMFAYADQLAAKASGAPARRPDHSAGRGGGGRRAAHAAGVRRLLHDALRRRQRDDAQPHRERDAGALRTSGAEGAPAGGPVADADGGGGDAALGLRGHVLQAHDDARGGDPRPADRAGRAGDNVVHLGQP